MEITITAMQRYVIANVIGQKESTDGINMEGRKSNFPICRLCGFHAEMYFGEWQMCSHQREEERIKQLEAEAQQEWTDYMMDLADDDEISRKMGE